MRTRTLLPLLAAALLASPVLAAQAAKADAAKPVAPKAAVAKPAAHNPDAARPAAPNPDAARPAAPKPAAGKAPAKVETPQAVGTWDVVATTPQGELPSVLTVKMVEGQPKAVFELGGLERLVTDEKLEANLLTLKVEYEGGVYDVEAKVDGASMTGSWQGGGYSGELTGKRRP